MWILDVRGRWCVSEGLPIVITVLLWWGMLTVGGRVMIVWGQGPYEKYHLLNFAVNLKPIKNLLAMQETQVQSLGWKDPLEKGMATHSSILAWRIPWTEEPGRLQAIGSPRVGHDWATNALPLCHYNYSSKTFEKKSSFKHHWNFLSMFSVFCVHASIFWNRTAHLERGKMPLRVRVLCLVHKHAPPHSQAKKKKVISVSSPGLEILLKIPPNYVYQSWLCSAEFSGAQDKRAFQKLRSTCYILRSTPFQKL